MIELERALASADSGACGDLYTPHAHAGLSPVPRRTPAMGEKPLVAAKL